jgi:hypothetical protein
MLTHVSRALAVSALAALTSCGGSGGGGGGPPVVVLLDNATLNGPYFMVYMAGESGPPDAEGATGLGTSDGEGGVPVSQTTNDMGTVTGPTGISYEYSVAGDGELAMGVGVIEVARGGVSADGECALVASSAFGPKPAVMALLRRGGTYSDASLSGAYHFVGFAVSVGGGESVGFTGPVTADGAGTLSGAAVGVNLMGTVGTAAVSGTYAIAADGTAQFTTSVPETFAGGVIKGGAVAVFGGSVTAGDAPGLLVFVRAAVSASDATFQGAYWAVTLSRDAVTGEFRSQTGTVTSDGAGNLTLEAVSNTEGTFVVEPPQPATYGVAADGTLTVGGGGHTMVGAITEDGSFAVAGGGTSPGSDPILVLLCRK